MSEGKAARVKAVYAEWTAFKERRRQEYRPEERDALLAKIKAVEAEVS